MSTSRTLTVTASNGARHTVLAATGWEVDGDVLCVKGADGSHLGAFRNWDAVTIHAPEAGAQASPGVSNGVVDALLDAARQLQEFATDQFGKFGPRDARGAALWDAAAHLTEKVAPRYAETQSSPCAH